MARLLTPTDHINCGDIAGLSYERTDSFTLSIWIKTDTPAVTETMFSKNLNTGTLRGWEIIQAAGKITFLFISTFPSNAIQVESSTTTWNDGVWHHVAIAYDGSSNASGVTLYVDGVDDTGSTIKDTLSATTDGGADVGIGSRNGTTILPWNGDLAEAATWNAELVSDEIVSLARGSSVSHIRNANLQGYWPLQGASSPEPDLSGFINPGTLTGTVRSVHPPVVMQSLRVFRFTALPQFEVIVALVGSMTTRRVIGVHLY